MADLALARAPTAKYVNNLQLAKANGYGIITKMIPNMGYHYMNPNVKGFDVRKPPILVYEHQGSTWQLGAIEWVFTSKPAKPPTPRRNLRSVRRRLPLQGRHVRPGDDAGRVPEDRPADRRCLQLLAPEPDHDARLALVPEPDRRLREHEPARPRLQPRLT